MNTLAKQWLRQLGPVAMSLALGLALLSTLACGIAESLLGNTKSAGSVSTLWSDVPPIEGATRSDLEMPLGFRLMIQAVSRGAIDYIAYSTDQTPDMVKDFYSVERMQTYDWQAADLNGNEAEQLSCVGDTSDATSEGVLCLFGKKEGEKDILLAIVVAQNEQTHQTDIFYARIDTSQFETPQAGETTSQDAAATQSAAGSSLIETSLPASPIRQFSYAGANFQVTQAVINNRDPNDPSATLPTSFQVQLSLSAENPSQFPVVFDAGQFQLNFSNGTTVKQSFGGAIGTRETQTFNISGPVAADTSWEGASLTLDEVDKEPLTVSLSGDPFVAPSPVVLNPGAAVTAQNQAGEGVQYQVTEATLNLDGLLTMGWERSPLGKRLLKVTVNVTNVGAQRGLTVGGGDFHMRADGVLSDIVYDETGIMTPSQGAQAVTTFWFLVPADAQNLTLIANVWNAATEIPLTR